MKAHFDDFGGEPEVKVSVKKGVKVKTLKDKVCGPHGVQHSVKLRVCPHNYVHPLDWPFSNIEDMDSGQRQQYLCPKKCFRVTIKL